METLTTDRLIWGDRLIRCRLIQVRLHSIPTKETSKISYAKVRRSLGSMRSIIAFTRINYFNVCGSSSFVADKLFFLTHSLGMFISFFWSL